MHYCFLNCRRTVGRRLRFKLEETIECVIAEAPRRCIRSRRRRREEQREEEEEQESLAAVWGALAAQSSAQVISRCTVWGGRLWNKLCEMSSESYHCLLGQNGSCSTAQWPVELAEYINKTLIRLYLNTLTFSVFMAVVMLKSFSCFCNHQKAFASV